MYDSRIDSAVIAAALCLHALAAYSPHDVKVKETWDEVTRRMIQDASVSVVQLRYKLQEYVSALDL